MENLPLSILVTAGGTIEDIDTVRGITNFSSGRLGAIIADEFTRGGARVTFLCGEKSLRPELPPHEVITIRNVAGLVKTLEELLGKTPFDCVIHSMAVSDFTPEYTFSVDDLCAALEIEEEMRVGSRRDLSAMLRAAITKAAQDPDEKKISSKNEQLVVVLGQTPKAIRRIKPIQPGTLLVGFKLLSGADEDDLLAAGYELMDKNRCDLVLANDLGDISSGGHKAILLDTDGIIGRANTKHEIARIIFDNVTQRIGRTK